MPYDAKPGFGYVQGRKNLIGLSFGFALVFVRRQI